MMPRRPLHLLAMLAFALAACERRADVGPVVVSVIGDRLVPAEASRGASAQSARLMTASVAQGLVRFDASGQIEPGLAARWIVIDGGMSYIFRMSGAEWQDGRRVVARDVVRILKRQLARGSRNPAKPFLTAIDDIVEMTPDVIEVRLERPRPDLLKLFAQPEMAIFRIRPPGGSGPFRVVARGAHSVTLTPAIDRNRAADEVRAAEPEENVRLIAERTARALVRFAAARSDLVTGGTIADWPLVALAELAPATIRVDPAAGLFGLAVVDRDGMLGDALVRDAIAQSFDRGAITQALAPQWQPTDAILPEQLDSQSPPVAPAWTATTIAERRANATRRIATWRADNPDRPATLRLALPSGPGGNLLWGQLGATLQAIGITPQRVGRDDPADLRLIDQVAPYDSARWYLATACVACSPEAEAALEAARLAPDLAARAAAIAAADVALAADAAFIPLARPFRWSAVSLRLREWRPNARAWHPLNHLRRDPNSR